MKTKSLAFRLVISSAIWSLLVLGVAGLLLSSNYRKSIEKSFDERLQIHLKALVAEVDIGENNTLIVQRALGDSRFDVPYSGWYWQILSPENKVALSSKSLFDAKLDDTDREMSPKTAAKFTYIAGPEGQTLRAISRPITLPDTARPHIFSVAGNAVEIEDAVHSFVRILSFGLMILALGILAALFIQIRFGLRPLKRVQEALGAIRSGKEKELHGDYPTEISPLVSELNSLLKANREVVERARTHVGNLAHSLKTPLSVLSNEVDVIEDHEQKGRMDTQVVKMRAQINHHLDRAQMAARTKTFGMATPVKPVVESLLRALNQINKDRGIKAQLRMEEDIIFAGEKQDLEEIIGNILENAFKFSNSVITVDISPLNDLNGGRSSNSLRIVIRDDGRGLSEQDITEALKRGRRLDESKPGSGLGLSIVTELVDIYEGEINLKSPESGGLRVDISLPRAG